MDRRFAALHQRRELVELQAGGEIGAVRKQQPHAGRLIVLHRDISRAELAVHLQRKAIELLRPVDADEEDFPLTPGGDPALGRCFVSCHGTLRCAKPALSCHGAGFTMDFQAASTPS